MAGGASKTGGGTWLTFSDERIKKDVTAYSDGLKTLLKINPVQFSYAAFDASVDTTKRYVGVIAQEMEKVAPYMVDTVSAHGFDDLRRYDASALTYMLVNAVREVNDKVDRLRLAQTGDTVTGMTTKDSGSSPSDSSVTVPVSMQGATVVTHAVSTVAEFTSSANDLDLAHNRTSVFRLSSTTDIDLTGILPAPDGRQVTLINVGASDIILRCDSENSSPTSRLKLSGRRDARLSADASITLLYDATSGRWRELHRNF